MAAIGSAELSADFGDWELAGRLALKVAEIYLTSVQSVAVAAREPGLALTARTLLSDAGPPISLEQKFRLGSALVPRLADELNKLDGRQPLRPSDWRVILYCVGGARTMREAIVRCADAFESVDGRCGRMLLRMRADVAELELNSLRTRASLAGCAIDLEGIAYFHGLLGWLIGARIPIGSIALDYDDATFRTLSLPRFPVTLQLASGWTGFSFSAAFLDYPVIRSADEVIDWPRHSFLVNVSEPDSSSNIGDRARRVALALWQGTGKFPSFEELSSRLGANSQAIRRRLAAAGTSFRHIKNSCRRERALKMLRHSTLSIEQISEDLDFCDSDAFRSAFKKWVGISPSGFREEQVV